MARAKSSQIDLKRQLSDTTNADNRVLARNTYQEFLLVNEPVEQRGLWVINLNDNKSPLCLVNAYIRFKLVTKSELTSVYPDINIEVQLLTRQDNTISYTISNSDYEYKKDLYKKFLGEIAFPTSDKEISMLHEAITLFSERAIKGIIADTLGWNILSDGTKIFMLANGYETKDGFVSFENALMKPPILSIAGKRYSGMEDIPEFNDNILELLLIKLSSNTQAISAGLLGTFMRLLYPYGENAGILRYPLELMGSTRHGKTARQNFFLAFLGSGFTNRTGTFLNIGDGGNTQKSRYEMLNRYPFIMLSDFDNAINIVGDKGYAANYNARNDLNKHYSDEHTGTYLSRQRNVKDRLPVNGGIIRTGEIDYAEYSILNNKLSTETRNNVFVLPCGKNCHDENCQYISGKDISIEITRHIKELYGIGYAYRKWYMIHTQKEIEEIYDSIQTEVFKLSKGNWLSADLQEQACMYVLEGMLLFRQFLLECYPKSIIIQWINDIIPLYVNNRLERAMYLHKGIYEKSNDDMLQDIVDAIQYNFVSQYWYLKSQENELIQVNHPDLPIDIDMIGYKKFPKNNNRIEHGKIHVGYLIQRKGKWYIAFIARLFFEGIKRQLKQNNKELLEEQIITVLKNSDYMLPFDKEKIGTKQRIVGDGRSFLIIELDKVYLAGNNREHREQSPKAALLADLKDMIDDENCSLLQGTQGTDLNENSKNETGNTGNTGNNGKIDDIVNNLVEL